MSQTTRMALWVAVPLLAAAAVSLAFVLRSSADAPANVVTASHDAGITWAAGEQRAPAIALHAADGSPLTLASLRGRRVIVTFVDPHCTTFCPRESVVVNDAIRTLPAPQRPVVVAVSVDPTVRSVHVLAREARRFHWLPQWRWAVGTHAELASVWRRYHVAVIPAKDDVNHTEAAYVVDARGYQRALLLWPFRARQVSRALAGAS